MFYFIYGDSPLPLKSDELIDKLKKENEGIPVKYFDASQGEEEQLLEGISINSMFSPKEMFILKRTEQIKKLDKFLETLLNYNLTQKIIVLIYEEFLNDFGKIDNEPSKKIFELIDKLGKKIVARKGNERRAIQIYIEENLDISEYESEKLGEILGEDFFKVKGEVDKIKNFLRGQKFSLEKVIPILSVSKEYDLRKLVENFILKRERKELIEFLKLNKEYMGFIGLLSEELILALKLTSLRKQGKIRKDISYNDFKNFVYEDIKKFFKKKRKGNSKVEYMKEYPIFLKLNYCDIYEEKFLLDMIEKLLKLDFSIKNGFIDDEMGTEKFIIEFIKESRREGEN